MRGAVGFHRPPHQQQAQHDTKHQLFLFRQHVHQGTLVGGGLARNCADLPDWNNLIKNYLSEMDMGHTTQMSDGMFQNQVTH
jgi:hypothetical protein